MICSKIICHGMCKRSCCMTLEHMANNQGAHPLPTGKCRLEVECKAIHRIQSTHGNKRTEPYRRTAGWNKKNVSVRSKCTFLSACGNRKKEITLADVRITSQIKLQACQVQKTREGVILANEVSPGRRYSAVIITV